MGYAVDADLQMDVWTGGIAGTAYQSQGFTGADRSAVLGDKFATVAVKGLHPAGMIYQHKFTGRLVFPHLGDGARHNTGDRRPFIGSDVQSLVETGLAGFGVIAVSKV